MSLDSNQNSLNALPKRSREEELKAVRQKISEVHEWRRRLAPQYHGSKEEEAALDDFTEPFIAVTEKFDIIEYPARRFLEKTKGAKKLSRKGAEIVAMRDRFRISPRIMDQPQAYIVRHWRDGLANPTPDALIGDCYLDAPFAYALEFKNSQGIWEVIALSAALPDFSTKSLMIEQLQGTGGIFDTSTEAAGVRLKFNTAVCVPFVAMALLARAAGLETIRVTKNAAWQQRIQGSIDSPYVQIPTRFHMDPGEGQNQYFSIATDKVFEI